MKTKSIQKILFIILPILLVFSSNIANADTTAVIYTNDSGNNELSIFATFNTDKLNYSEGETVHFVAFVGASPIFYETFTEEGIDYNAAYMVELGNNSISFKNPLNQVINVGSYIYEIQNSDPLGLYKANFVFDLNWRQEIDGVCASETCYILWCDINLISKTVQTTFNVVNTGPKIFVK